MAKKYGKKNMGRQSSKGFGSSLILACTTFIAGYFTASLFNPNQILAWVNERVANQSTQPVVKAATQASQLPKPKFEFYTLLANEQVKTTPSQSTNPVQTAPATNVAASRVAPVPILKQGMPSSAVLATTQKLPAPFAANESLSKTDLNNGYFIIQVGSFKKLNEAEKMKATLIMRGFNASIANASQQGVLWYRVTMGPFATKTEAQKVQLAFARNAHVMGMIRKIDV